MSAQYYYLEADGLTVSGPFSLQDMWGLRDRELLPPGTQVSRGEGGEWATLESFSELRPAPRASTPPPTPPPTAMPSAAPLPSVQPLPAPVRPAAKRNGCAIAFLAVGLPLLVIVIIVAVKGPSPSGSTSSAVRDQYEINGSPEYQQAYKYGRFQGVAQGRWHKPYITADVMERKKQDVHKRTGVHQVDYDWDRGFEDGYRAGYDEGAR